MIGEELGRVGRQHVGELQAASTSRLRREPERAREGRVHVLQSAVSAGDGEADRHVVVAVEDAVQVCDLIRFQRPLAGDVTDLPEG